MLHHPHVIASKGKRTMTQYVAPSDCHLNNLLCNACPQYLGTVIVCTFLVLLSTQVMSAYWFVWEQ